MCDTRRPFVLFNPAAGRGRSSLKRINMFLELLGQHLPKFDYVVTEKPGQEAALVDQAIQSGFNFIVAVGGDGTWSNVADRILRSGRPDLLFGMLASGTGNDFGRNFQIAVDKAEEGVLSLAGGKVARVDVGRIVTPGTPVGLAPDHQPIAGRHFLNLVGFGFDVACIETAAEALFLRGELLYKTAALKNILFFPGVDIGLEGEMEPIDGRHLMVTISNGPFFGGSFPIAPNARLDDALLDVCAIGDAGPLKRIQLFGLAAKGKHVGSSFVTEKTGRAFRATFNQAPKYEVDGEVWRAAGPEVAVEVLPKALNIIAPSNF
ncbi:MAG: diacylglycerol/lipid kinase family protein [Longimicrobiales bacterium]